MPRSTYLSLLALSAGAFLFVASALASPRRSPPIKEGGTLYVNVAGTDLPSLDPAVGFDTDVAQIFYATCAKLVSYPDARAPGGSHLVPEVASALPTVTADGLTYTFTLRPDFRFSNGQPLRAADFAYAVRRDRHPRMHSPAVAFLHDVQSVTAPAPNRLVVRLTRPAPDLPARLAMPFFCAVPEGTPINPKGIDTIPSAGPYYVASRDRGMSVTLKRNPFYGGTRPNHLDEIDFRVFRDWPTSIQEIEQGTADYEVHGVPPAFVPRLALKYGVNGPRFFAHPVVSTDYLALNTSRPLFRDTSVRKAVAYAIDRRALRDAGGPYSGKVTDQLLPPAMPGFKNAKLYPDRPDLPRAKRLMRGRRARAVLYVLSGPQTPLVPVISRDLRAIGIDVDPRYLPAGAWQTRVQSGSAAYDIAIYGWTADYLDPYDFINILLYGGNIKRVGNENLAHFDDPVFNRRMEAAARLTGKARYAAYARLDADLMRAAPIVPFENSFKQELVSKRVGCTVIAPGAGGFDYAAACLR